MLAIRQGMSNDKNMWLHLQQTSSAKMDIDGELPDGTMEPVFRRGNWAIQPRA
ncbi:hypothetical protein GCM10020370_62600 [Paenibacillus hodogayensis]